MCAQAEDPPRTKRCSKCGEEKALDVFYKRTASADGLNARCIECHSAAAKRRYARDREVVLARVHRYRVQNLEKVRQREAAQVAPRRAYHRERNWRRAGITDPQMIEWCHMLANDPCSYCGVRPANGIDHIHPSSKGGTHSRENLTACCKGCNIEKWTRPLLTSLLARAE